MGVGGSFCEFTPQFEVLLCALPQSADSAVPTGRPARGRHGDSWLQRDHRTPVTRGTDPLRLLGFQLATGVLT